MKFKLVLVFFLIMVLAPGSVYAGKWSKFHEVYTKDGLVISYRSILRKNGWTADWWVVNNSSDWAKPLVKKRSYICGDGTRQSLGGKSLGVFPPGDKGPSGFIRDNGVCPGSKIESVETEIEIRAVSDATREAWD